MDNQRHEQNGSDSTFSIIPHWLIFSGVSSGAIHLYAVLAKYADNNTGEAFPSRSKLARDLNKSVDTVDRLNVELVKAGALEVTRRRRTGSKQNYSNLYTLVKPDPTEHEPPEKPETDPEGVAEYS